jgi:bifunctional UDP-N-acetylglucosamine pyrophosphorylase/glucosamine-1-phosphate N-acetyltransferase
LKVFEEAEGMKVVLFCGGIGKRMFPITEDKFLLRFLGKTLLEHQIETAKEAGLTEFVIVGNPQNMNRIAEIVTSLPDIKVELALQKEPLGLANALESVSQFLDGQIIVVNPNDVFESFAYTKLLEAQRAGPAVSYLLGYEVTDYFPGGYLVVSEAGELQRIIEKPERGKEPSNLVNLVVHLHTDPKRILEYAESIQTDKDDVYECAIDAMARDRHRIKVVPYAGFWSPIKYPWHIFSLVQRFLDRSQKYISPSAYISEQATIEDKVVIGDNVRILENAVIRGPVYIGPNSVIGNNSLVRDYSHIGTDCVVGYSTEVKGSYIGDGCWFHMSYIGDSVIGDGCSFGAGTVLGNLRFDERNISVRMRDESVGTGLDKFGAIVGNNSKTGVHVSVMPGVRIGPNSIVGPHVCLTDDLEPDKLILAEPVHKTIRNRFQRESRRRA